MLTFRPEFSWEFLSKEEINIRSLKAINNHLSHIKEVSPYYREKLKDTDIAQLESLEDFSKLPLTSKDDIVENIGAFKAVPDVEICETVVTSGSTGKFLIFKLTRGDLERLAFNEALSFNSAGVTPEDKAQILVSLDRLFIAGIAYYRGLTSLGVDTTRIGVLPFEMQKFYFDILKPTVLVGVPSFIKKFGQELKKSGYNVKNSSVKKIFCIGESIRDESLKPSGTGQIIEELFNAKTYSTYAATELSVAYCECEKQEGNHAHPELVYTEIVDPNGKPVEDGEIGELVATPLGVEGMPLLRYRTGDITFKVKGSCECGRNSDRIGPILSRKSQMLKLQGTTVYPLTITNTLDEIDSVEDYILVIEGDRSLADKAELHVVAKPAEVFRISEHLRAKARVSVPVLITNSTTINSMRDGRRKKIKILDKRLSNGRSGSAFC